MGARLPKLSVGKLVISLVFVFFVLFIRQGTAENEEVENIEIEQEATPQAVVPAAGLAAHERVAENYAELKDALSKDNGVTTVYLGSDIIIQLTGIRVHPKKTNIIVDGLNPLDPGQTTPHTLTDYNSSTFTDTIYIDTAGPKTLLVRNLNIIGKNYYGSFSVLDISGLSDFVITYQNVRYNGPQIGHHRRGLLCFTDCSVHIHGQNGLSAKQEFAEAKNLLFAGVNTIDTESTATSVFWHPYGGHFQIADDSSLTLTSSNTSALFGLFYATGSAYAVDIDIGERAALNISLSGVIAAKTSATLSSLTVGEGGVFQLATTKEAGEAVLSMGGALTVDRDAAFIINGYGSPSYPVIAQSAGDITVNQDAVFHIIASGSYPMLIDLYGCALICNDPASVLLYNNGKVTGAESAARIYLNAEQINYWNALSGGGLDEPPVISWRKGDTSNFWIDGTLATSGNFSSLSSNYETDDPPGVEPDASSFNMNTIRVLALGRLELVVTAPTANAVNVTGITAPGASLRVSIPQQGTRDAAANAEGVFSVHTGMPLEAHTVITIQSNYRYLNAYRDVVVMEEGRLALTVPDKIRFFDTPLALNKSLAQRLDPDWHIVVSDTRETGGGWRLYARLAKPLTPSDSAKPVLMDAVVFVDDNHAIHPITNGGMSIYHHTSPPGDGVVKIHWPADRGLLIQIPIHMAYIKMAYTAVIEWTLIQAP